MSHGAGPAPVAAGAVVAARRGGLAPDSVAKMQHQRLAKRARTTTTNLITETVLVTQTRTVDGQAITTTRTNLVTTTGVVTPSNIQTVYIQQITIGATPATASVTVVNGTTITLGATSVATTTSSVPASSTTSFISLALLSSASAVPTVTSIAAINGNAAPATNSSDSGLSGGAIAGIAIASLLGLLGLIALIMWIVSRRREDRARNETSDMMGPSALPDPYAAGMLSRETPGSFVRFNDDDSMSNVGGAAAAGRRPVSGYSRGGDDDGYDANGNTAYDDYSGDDFDRRGSRGRY